MVAGMAGYGGMKGANDCVCVVVVVGGGDS